jgi:hypothetical protein
LILNALFYIIVVHGTQIEKAGEIMGSIFQYLTPDEAIYTGKAAKRIFNALKGAK